MKKFKCALYRLFSQVFVCASVITEKTSKQTPFAIYMTVSKKKNLINFKTELQKLLFNIFS